MEVVIVLPFSVLTIDEAYRRIPSESGKRELLGSRRESEGFKVSIQQTSFRMWVCLLQRSLYLEDTTNNAGLCEPRKPCLSAQQTRIWVCTLYQRTYDDEEAIVCTYLSQPLLASRPSPIDGSLTQPPGTSGLDADGYSVVGMAEALASRTMWTLPLNLLRMKLTG